MKGKKNPSFILLVRATTKSNSLPWMTCKRSWRLSHISMKERVLGFINRSIPTNPSSLPLTVHHEDKLPPSWILDWENVGEDRPCNWLLPRPLPSIHYKLCHPSLVIHRNRSPVPNLHPTINFHAQTPTSWHVAEW